MSNLPKYNIYEIVGNTIFTCVMFKIPRLQFDTPKNTRERVKIKQFAFACLGLGMVYM
jgi:hypothetical protein